MITALCITALPTLLAYLVLRSTALNPKSMYLKLVLSWFVGLFFFTMLTFCLSILFRFVTTAVLLKATYTSLLITNLLLILFITPLHSVFVSSKKILHRKPFFKPLNLLIIITSFAFAYAFFAPHVMMQQEKIYTSVIYWDFHWHAALIQNFAYGDNFPPQNEALAGEPITYHFFGDLVMAIYVIAGLSLPIAVTTTSILFLMMLFFTFIGLSETFFNTKGIGILACVLTSTSSSGHFLYYFAEHNKQPLWQTIQGIFTGSSHPWYLSHIANSPFGYNGTMFNLFYVLEERHLLIGLVYLLLCLFIIAKRNQLSNLLLVSLGLLMGGFFFWHLYLTAMIGIGLFFLLLFGENRNQTLILLGCFLLVFVAQYLCLKQLLESSPLFAADAAHYPKINFNFAVSHPDDSPLANIAEMLMYYIFAYGLKLFLFPFAIALLWRQHKQLTILMLSFILPVFIIINTLQISPTAIHENHKLLIPMTILINLTVGYFLYIFFFKDKVLSRIILGIIFLIVLTLSGVIEDMPFLKAKPTELYADYSTSSLSRTIQKQTEPEAVFVGKDKREIQLAGRKLFVGESAGPAPAINTKIREDAANSLYQTNDITLFCTIAQTNKIDYVEMSQQTIQTLPARFMTLPYFQAYDSEHKAVFFLHTKRGCINPTVPIQ